MSHSRITVRITPPEPQKIKHHKPEVESVTVFEQPSKLPATPSRTNSFRSRPLRRRRIRSKSINRFTRLWNNHILLRIAIPAISAVAVGIVFGVATLNLFTNEQWNSKAMIDKASAGMGTTFQPSAGSGQPSVGTPQESGNQTSAEPQVKVLQFPAKTIYVVQAGVFENEEGADTLQARFHEQGWPAVLWKNERAHLLLAVGNDRNDVLSLATYFKNNGAEIYLKEWELPLLNFSMESDVPENVKMIGEFVDNSMQLWELLSTASARAIESGAGTAIDDELRDSIITRHQTLLKDEKDLAPVNLPGERQYVSHMLQSLTSAVSKFEQYQKQPHPSYIMSLQEQLLQYADHYQKWLQQLEQESR